MSVRLSRHDAASAAAYRDRILTLWPRVFEPVADEEDWRTRFWEQHRGRDGFRLITAERGEERGGERDGELLGFAWGYVGERGQWWAEMVHGALEAGAGEKGAREVDADLWVGGHFEVVELAVVPEQRGQGLGAALFDALLADLPQDRALLQTDADPDTAGHRLYLRRGWSVLAELSPAKVVMGARLAA